MRSKVLLWSVVAILGLGLAAGLGWWWLRPQTIVLGDGTRLTLVGVTYGKSHALGKSKLGGRKIRSGTLATTNDSLCLWIDQKHTKNNWPNYQVLAFDAANTACSGHSMMTYGNFSGNNQGEEVVGIVFDAFPRRGSKINFRFQQWNQKNGQQSVSKNGFSIRNPAGHGTYASWKPEPLPITEQDEELQVTLTRFEAGAGHFNNFGRNNSTKSDDPMNRGVLTAFRIEQNGGAATNWQPVQIDTFDATGNHSRNRNWSNHREGDEQVMTYQWGLWPEEPAWKIRVEMSRQSGYTAAEIWTASGIPLKPGDMNDMWQPNKRGKPVAETVIGDIQLQVFPVTQLSGQQARMYGGGIDGIVLIHANPAPDGRRMAVVSITDDQGKPVEYQNWGGGGSDFRFALKKIGDAKSVNITLALHKSRYVEFMVQPKKK